MASLWWREGGRGGRTEGRREEGGREGRREEGGREGREEGLGGRREEGGEEGGEEVAEEEYGLADNALINREAEMTVGLMREVGGGGGGEGGTCIDHRGREGSS